MFYILYKVKTGNQLKYLLIKDQLASAKIRDWSELAVNVRGDKLTGLDDSHTRAYALSAYLAHIIVRHI